LLPHTTPHVTTTENDQVTKRALSTASRTPDHHQNHPPPTIRWPTGRNPTPSGHL